MRIRSKPNRDKSSLNGRDYMSRRYDGVPWRDGLHLHSFRADSAKRGLAISFVTLASVALADSLFDFFFLVITP